MIREDPSLPWGTVAALAAAGVLLLAFFVGRSGSPVALTAALLVAAILGTVAVVSRLRQAGRGARPRRRAVVVTEAAPPAKAPDAPLAPRPAAWPALPEDPHPARPSSTAERTARALSMEALRGSVEDVARGIALAAIDEVAAPASAVLVEREGKLTAAASAGDWAATRRGLRDLTGPGLYDAASDDGDPPEFPLDPRQDLLTRLLAMYGRPIPLERWGELADVPPLFLPLVGLAASGVGAAVPLGRRGRLAGLWVVAQRPDGGPYTDEELVALRRLASGAARALADAGKK